ncbi:MAG TPA: GntR family transcriptional regulator, partial [Vicinamibacteria bacterium]|nr:GntR family transcriptional regulator [Vicinamibacteria bacterium]
MALEIVLNRRGGVPIRDQLVTQLELKILDGSLTHGQRLPSVRSLARRLKVHHNTVSAAYQDLEEAGHVELQRGSGVFVRRAGVSQLPEAKGLDEMIRLALHAAFRKGFSGSDIRSAVERWLAASPPDRVVVVDPSPEMGELLVHELKMLLGIPASA